MTDYDDTPDKSPDTTRRRFLGAAGTAAVLAATGNSTATTDVKENADDADDSAPEYTGTNTDPDKAGFSGDLDLWGGFNDPQDYELRPSQIADEELDVSLILPFEYGTVRLGFTLDEAEAFTDELLAEARRGDNGLGKR